MQTIIIVAAVTAILIFLIVRVFSNREKQLIKKLYELEKAGKLTDAILTARQLLDIHPNFAAYHWRLAKLYEKNNTPASAMKVYETMKDKSIISSTVKMEMVLEGLVTLQLKNKDYPKAFINSLLLMKYNPKNLLGLVTLARLYASQSKTEEAYARIQEAIKASQNNSEAHMYYGLMLLDAGELKSAISELEFSLKNDSHNANTQYFLAAAYRQAGFADRAQALFDNLKIDVEKIPANIMNLGILRQHMPKMDLDQLKQTVGKKDKGPAAILTFDAFMDAPPENFHETVRSILGHLGYTIRQELQDQAIDPKTIVAAITDKDGIACYIEFHRTDAEIGLIPFSEFIQRMEQKGLPSGLFITTSRLASSSGKLVTQTVNQVTVIDHEGLKRFLR